MTSANRTSAQLQGKWLQIAIRQALIINHLPATQAAINLLAMVAAHESGGFTYLKQVRGPALSIYQIEPLTYDDICSYAMRKNYLPGELPNPVERLIFDFPFATCIARIFFMRLPEKLPGKNDVTGLARYAKQYWNTEKGKATEEHYRNAYLKFWG